VWKNTTKVWNYRVSLSSNTSKMNLLLVLVKSRHRSSFVSGLCRQSSETSELINLIIQGNYKRNRHFQHYVVSQPLA
jgi:hypothetical protein